MSSRQIQTEELTRDVKNINSAYVKEIETMKGCHFQGDYERPESKKVYNKSAPFHHKMIPTKLKKLKNKLKSESSRYQIDGIDDTVDAEFIGDKCEMIFDREIDKNTMKSNNDIMKEMVVNDDYLIHDCRTNSKTSSKTSSNVKNKELILNSDEIKLMSLLGTVDDTN